MSNNKCDGWEQWLRTVLDTENMKDWKYEISSSGNMCWLKRKIITVSEHNKNNPGMWLHEIAHAKRQEMAIRCGDTRYPEIGTQYHDAFLCDIFTDLVYKYCTFDFTFSRNRKWSWESYNYGNAETILNKQEN